MAKTNQNAVNTAREIVSLAWKLGAVCADRAGQLMAAHGELVNAAGGFEQLTALMATHRGGMGGVVSIDAESRKVQYRGGNPVLQAIATPMLLAGLTDHRVRNVLTDIKKATQRGELIGASGYIDPVRTLELREQRRNAAKRRNTENTGNVGNIKNTKNIKNTENTGNIKNTKNIGDVGNIIRITSDTDEINVLGLFARWIADKQDMYPAIYHNFAVAIANARLELENRTKAKK